MESLSYAFPLDPATPRAARRVIAERFAGTARCHELLLCVSEVVTNAVLHARSAPRMTISERGHIVRVEVTDDDPTLPERRYLGATAPTGRGLHLLDSLTTRWGADRVDGSGKVVWFEFETGGDG